MIESSPEDRSPSTQRSPASQDFTRETLDALAGRVCQGDDQALTQLHAALTPGLTRHFQRLLAAAAARPSLQPSEHAYELAHQTWIVFWQALRTGKYDPAKARLSTFLYAVASNIWLRHRRAVGKASRQVPFSALEAARHDLQRADPDAPSPANAVELASELDAIRRILAGDLSAAPGAEALTPDDRDVLRMIAEGKSDRELAALLDVAASTAHARKKQALVRLVAVLASLGLAAPKTSQSPSAPARSARITLDHPAPNLPPKPA